MYFYSEVAKSTFDAQYVENVFSHKDMLYRDPHKGYKNYYFYIYQETEGLQ